MRHILLASLIRAHPDRRILVGIPDRLKYARDRAGLTGPQVKESTGIGESLLSEFEKGRREPSLSQLQVLAAAYRRSVAFFLAEGTVVPEVVLWRQRPVEGAAEIEARFLRLCEQYHNLEERNIMHNCIQNSAWQQYRCGPSDLPRELRSSRKR
jgi:transcriptional regulator with XRE-family HTH domain